MGLSGSRMNMSENSTDTSGIHITTLGFLVTTLKYIFPN